jgi:hypothetical protein
MVRSKNISIEEANNVSNEATEPVLNSTQNESTINNRNQVSNPSLYKNVFDYITEHFGKIQNVEVVDMNFESVPAGKYLMFKTKTNNDADVILIDEPKIFWVENEIPISIRVENSGIIIVAPSKRMYVSKTNTTIIKLNESGKTLSIETLSKALKAESIKINSNNNNETSRDIEAVKIHIKAISPKLFNMTKDLTTITDIKTTILSFINKTKDLNHILKIEGQDLMSCQI